MTSETKKRIADINNGIIPDGYKKTKVGIVPMEWETVKLKNISKHKTEKNKEMKYKETYTNSATQGIIKQTDYFDKQISNVENIDSYYIVCKNDYVYNPRISVSAPCGPISKSHFDETGIMSPLYTVFRLNDEYENNAYIEYYFKSTFWYRYMSSVANYGARHDRMNITNEDLFNMSIPLPPLPEQQKIAEILSAQDKLISLQEKKTEKLKELKKAYLQKMFPKKGSKSPELRFKGFTDDWEQRELIQVCDYVDYRGKTPTKTDSGVFLVTAKNVKDGYIDYETSKEYIAEEDFEEVMRRGKAEIGDVLITTEAPCGNVAQVNRRNIALAQRIIKYRGHLNVIDNTYLKHYLLSPEFKKTLLEKSSGGTVQGIKGSVLHQQSVMYPKYDEQVLIGKYFDNLDNLITLNQRKLEQEKQKKKALMQLLLTGKVRVKL